MDALSISNLREDGSFSCLVTSVTKDSLTALTSIITFFNQCNLEGGDSMLEPKYFLAQVGILSFVHGKFLPFCHYSSC